MTRHRPLATPSTRALGLLASLVMVATTGCGALNAYLDEKADPLGAGQRSLNAKQYDEAIAHFARVAEGDRHYQRARFLIGTATALKGEPGEGLALMLRARAIDPETFDDTNNLKSGEDLGDLFTVQSHAWSVDLGASITGVYDAPGVILAVSDREVLTAISKETRSVLWEQTLGRRGASNPVVVTDGRLVFAMHAASGAYANTTLRALELATGRERWSVDVGIDYRHSQPALAGSLVLIGRGDRTAGLRQAGTLTALRASSGKVAWTTKVSGIPGPIAVDKKYICTQTSTDQVACVRPNGRGLWTYELPDNSSRQYLAVRGDRVFLALPKALYALNIRGAQDLHWKAPLRRRAHSAPLLDGDRLLVQATDTLQAFAIADGSASWAAPVPYHRRMGHLEHGRPAVAAGQALGWSSSWAFAVAADSGELLWAARFGGKSLLAPPIGEADGTVYVAAGKKLHALNPRPWSSLMRPEESVAAAE